MSMVFIFVFMFDLVFESLCVFSKFVAAVSRQLPHISKSVVLLVLLCEIL